MTYKRVNKKTPNGGDYSEIYYLDDEHNVVDAKIATKCIIRECKKDGTLIRETWGILKR